MNPFVLYFYGDAGTPHRKTPFDMSTERAIQNRVFALFRDELKYDYLVAWTDRSNNNIEETLLMPRLLLSAIA